MWYITHISTGNCFYFAADGKSFIVGRVGADLELQADICVSRSHAVFHLKDDQLELEDAGSKYGTYHNQGIENKATLKKGCKAKLKEGDLIRFGLLQNVWKVGKLTFNTVTSSLAKEDVEQVAASISVVGGKVLPQWSSQCTHLTMRDASVTVKLLHALVDQKLVVTPYYWKDLAKAVAEKKSHLPKAELYCPSFGDDNIDVTCKPQRRYLFKGKTFVFLSRKHVDMYGPIVNAAGGSWKDINSGVQKAFLLKNNVIVIQYNPSSQTQSSQTIHTIAEFLQSRAKRIIPEYELGLAILNCSLEEFCNPNYKMPDSMAQTVSNDNPDNSISAALSEGQTTASMNTESLELEIPDTNDKLVTSTPYEKIDACSENSSDKEDEQLTMPNIHITETPVDVKNKKRKHVNVLSAIEQESDNDEDLFQFAKKACRPQIDGNPKDHSKTVVGKASTKSKGGSTRNISNDKQNETEEERPKPSNARTIKKSVFADFLEKTQNKNKHKTLPASEEDINDSVSSTIKGARKRPRIQVLVENENNDGEDDDLFSFGDTQSNKRKRNDNQKATNSDTGRNGSDDDLFGFKEKESASIALDEDSTDLQATETFEAPQNKSKSSSYVVPKPKEIPRKILAMDWLSGCLGKVKIKQDRDLKNEEDIIKTEEYGERKPSTDELYMSEDHRKWLESLKNAIEIQEVSLDTTLNHNEKSHYKFKNPQSVNENSTVGRNFKKFVKKYQPSSQRNSIVVQLHVR